MNETMAFWLASRTLAERWREEMTGERANRQPRAHRSRGAARWRGWLGGRIAAALGMARRGRALRRAPASGPECCGPGCNA